MLLAANINRVFTARPEAAHQNTLTSAHFVCEQLQICLPCNFLLLYNSKLCLSSFNFHLKFITVPLVLSSDMRPVK